jgi:hypothetical protein
MILRSYQTFLLKILADQKMPLISVNEKDMIEALPTTQLAQLYVDVAFFTSAVKFIGEERWLQNKNSTIEITFDIFLKKLLASEISPLFFLAEFFEGITLERTVAAGQTAALIQTFVIKVVQTRTNSEQKIFARTALLSMSELFEFENQLMLQKINLGQHLGLSLYRTFDSLDEVFNLRYSADFGMPIQTSTTERLYEGAGVGVQSGYSSALLALRHLNPAEKSRFIDLGAGYGRIGLIVGLLRPDIDFIGYEFVPHRVKIAEEATEKLDLRSHVQFRIQDLSLQEFCIPVAETYYIYDSFSESTYLHVLAQLRGISQNKKITIITKGNARHWLESQSQNGHWALDRQFDNGNLCFYQAG